MLGTLATLSDTDVRAKVERCRGRLLAQSPWFGALGMNLRIRQVTTCSLMATDGTHLFYNALGCAAATEPELMFVWAHEIYHCGLLHMYRKPSWLDWHEWNICTDLAINAQLIEMGVGKQPAGILYDAQYANLSAEQIAHARRKARQQAEQEQREREQAEQPEQADDDTDDDSTQDDTDESEQEQEQDADDTDADADADDDGTQDDKTGEDVGGTAGNEDEQAGDGESDDGTGPSDDDGTESETGEPNDQDAGADDDASNGEGDAGEPGEDVGGTGPAYDPTNPDGTLEPGDDCLPPPTGADGEQDEQQADALDETQWQTAVDQATAITRKAGEMPGLVERAIAATHKPRTDWREVWRTFVEQVNPTDYTWQRPNRRYLSGGLYLPGTHRENLPPILVVVDTSGSCSQHELDIFAGALTSILQECKPREVTVIYCDTRVNGECERFTPDDGEVVLTTRGGGGTYFQPAFDWLVDAQADGTLVEPPCCILYLTDGYAADLSRLIEPEIPTLFAIVPGGTLEMPFGEVIAMEVD